MRRRKRKVLTWLSTLLLLAVGLLWVRSASREDQITLAADDLRLSVGSSSHRFWIKGAKSLSTSWGLETQFDAREAERFQAGQLLPGYEKTLFSRSFLVPYWIILLPFTVLPLRAFLSRPRRRAISPDQITGETRQRSRRSSGHRSARRVRSAA